MKNLYKVMAMLLCVVMLGSVLCSCGSNNSGKTTATNVAKDDMTKHVKLKWYVTAVEPAGLKEVVAAANEYLNKKLNCELDLQVIASADYDSKMQLALSANEEFDLVWTSNWKFNYESNVLKGAFQPLDDYLNSPDLADLKKFYPDSIWGAATVGDKIYGVPMQQVMYNQKGCTFLKDYLDKYGFTNYYDQVHNMDELADLYQTIKDGEAGDSTFFITTSNQKDYFIPETTNITSGWYIKDGEVTDRRDEYNEYRRQMRDWNQRGFFPDGVATLTDTTNMNILSGYTRYLPGVEGKAKLRSNKDTIVVPTTKAFMGRNGIQSTLTAVSATSKNPMRALKLIYLTHTDPYLLNLLCYGIEGRDYTKDPNNPKRMNRSSDSYYLAEFLMGNQFLAYLAPSYADDVWEQTKKENAEADVDPNIAFSFDPSQIQTEISQVSSINEEYKKIFEYGLQDPETSIPEFYKKLDLAGSNEIKTEIERQYKAWKAKK